MPEENPEAELQAKQEAEKMSDRELIANPEQHESVLTQIVAELRSGGYFREGDQITLIFPEAGKLQGPWRKQDGSWREGMGKAVAKYETSVLSSPHNPEVLAKFPKGDHLHKALLEAGYLVDVWPNYAGMTADADAVDYYVYEAPDKK